MVFQAIRAPSHKVIGTDNGVSVPGKLFRAIPHVVEDIPNTGARLNPRLVAVNIKFGRERVSRILLFNADILVEPVAGVAPACSQFAGLDAVADVIVGVGVILLSIIRSGNQLTSGIVIRDDSSFLPPSGMIRQQGRPSERIVTVPVGENFPSRGILVHKGRNGIPAILVLECRWANPCRSAIHLHRNAR